MLGASAAVHDSMAIQSTPVPKKGWVAARACAGAGVGGVAGGVVGAGSACCYQGANKPRVQGGGGRARVCARVCRRERDEEGLFSLSARSSSSAHGMAATTVRPRSEGEGSA